MTQLGKYELHEVIGRGGFGSVYRATDIGLKRVVAIKILHPQWAVDPTFIERFQREARLLASLEHPHIVWVTEIGEVDGYFFIAMRYLPGGSLADRLKQGAMSVDEAARVMQQVCSGLQELHNRGYIHRDLKPANILFDAQGQAVITDFGLARATVGGTNSTSSGFGTAGTPAYRAPELWRGKPPASPAADVYSLGCIWSEMLTGKTLFDGDTSEEVLTKHLIDAPDFGPHWPPAGVPRALAAVIEQSLAKDPAGRYDCAAALHAAVQQSLQPATAVKPPLPPEENPTPIIDPPPPPPRTPWLVPVLVGMAAVVLLAAAASRIFPPPPLGIGSTQVSPKDGMVQVYVPAGEFLMGSTDADGEADADEKPQHSVQLDAFWIDQTEVTNAQYAQCVAAGACQPPPGSSSHNRSDYYSNAAYSKHPVINVDWNQASAYCGWAGGRLPSEAEWEKAARGSDGRIYPWGNEAPTVQLANYDAKDTAAVGSRPDGASPYGALDMAGNVWEWTADWYDAGYYQTSPAQNPTGPASGTYRVLRGGSWLNSSRLSRSALRFWYVPGNGNGNMGFRCAR